MIKQGLPLSTVKKRERKLNVIYTAWKSMLLMVLGKIRNYIQLKVSHQFEICHLAHCRSLGHQTEQEVLRVFQCRLSQDYQTPSPNFITTTIAPSLLLSASPQLLASPNWFDISVILPSWLLTSLSFFVVFPEWFSCIQCLDARTAGQGRRSEKWKAACNRTVQWKWGVQGDIGEAGAD